MGSRQASKGSKKGKKGNANQSIGKGKDYSDIYANLIDSTERGEVTALDEEAISDQKEVSRVYREMTSVLMKAHNSENRGLQNAMNLKNAAVESLRGTPYYEHALKEDPTFMPLSRKPPTPVPRHDVVIDDDDET